MHTHSSLDRWQDPLAVFVAGFGGVFAPSARRRCDVVMGVDHLRVSRLPEV